MAQLVEQLLLTPEVRSSNPVIGKLLYRTFNCLSTVNCIEKTKIKKKEAENGPFFKKKIMRKKMTCLAHKTHLETVIVGITKTQKRT